MALWLAAHSSAAQAVPMQEWVAPAECPGAAEAHTELARHLPPQRKAAANARARVVITRMSPELLEARVSLAAPGGARREHVLRDASCVALTRAAALVIALALVEPEPSADRRAQAAEQKGLPQRTEADPSASAVSELDEAPLLAAGEVTAPGASEPVASGADGALGDTGPLAAADMAPTAPARAEPALETPTAPPARTPQPSAAVIDRPEPDETQESTEQPTRAELFIGAAAGVSEGVLPRIAPTVGLQLGVTWGAFIGAIRFGFAPAQSAALDVPQGVGGQVALLHAALEAGLRFSGLGLELPLLVGVEPGLFLARGVGIPERDQHVSSWLATYVSPGISRTWNQRWRASVRLDGLLALQRPRFALSDGAVAPRVFHQPERLGARVILGLDFILR